MAGLAPKNKFSRPTQPFLPPLPYTTFQDSAAPPVRSHQTSISSPSAAPPSCASRHSHPSLSGPLSESQPSGPRTSLSTAAMKRQEEEEDQHESAVATRPAHRNTRQAISRARGMKPLTLTGKPSPAAPPSASSEETGSGEGSLNSPHTAEARVASVNPIAAPLRPHPPPQSPPPRQQHEPLSASEHDGQQERTTDLLSLPAVYRPSALQFTRAIQRLNKMTSTMCAADATTSLEFVEAEPHVRKATRGPLPSDSSSVPSSLSSVRGGRVRKLTTVPLLPLVVCTDGTTVVLVDYNGTSRHGNYIQAMDRHVQHVTAAAAADEKRGNLPTQSPSASSVSASSSVLWWTVEDLRSRAGTLPLSSARASFSDGDGVASRLNSQGTSSPLHQSSLRGIQPDGLTLPYGEGLVLTLTTSAATKAEGISTTVMERSPPANEKAQPHLAAVRRASSPLVCPSLSANFLCDLSHGYLPSLLESVYPHGGVHLRGCWCATESSGGSTHGAAPSLSSTHTSNLRMGTASIPDDQQREIDENVNIVRVIEPLLHFSHAPAGRSSLNGHSGANLCAAAAAATAARTMQSLRPTSFPHPPPTSKGSLALPLLDLPEAVLRFLLPREAPQAELSNVPARPLTPMHITESSLKESARSSGASVTQDPPHDSPVEETVSTSRTSSPSGEVLIGADMRDFTTVSHAPSSSGVRYVSPLLRRSWPAGGGEPSASCTSSREMLSMVVVVVLTPMGRVELVPPDTVTSSTTALSSFAAASYDPWTIRDVKYSLLCSAVGQALHLGETSMALVYGPGTPALEDDARLVGQQVVLRLRCCSNNDA